MISKSLRYWVIVGHLFLSTPFSALAWNNETHLAVAKAAGYSKWYNAAGADMIKVKAGKIEEPNHYVANLFTTTVTAEMVLKQVRRYDQEDWKGHLYGAIVASVRNYLAERDKGKYGQFHLGFCAHYVGDLSMPLHNSFLNVFTREQRSIIDGLVEDEVLENLAKIKVYPVKIGSEEDLVGEIARIANLSLELERRMESESRLPTKEEVYIQLGHSASLLKGILLFVERNN